MVNKIKCFLGFHLIAQATHALSLDDWYRYTCVRCGLSKHRDDWLRRPSFMRKTVEYPLSFSDINLKILLEAHVVSKRRQSNRA